ncbi:MAG: hypothetical protein SGI89_01905 [bacterium]|nr:hypothetical protein [bacterium]
MKKNFVLFFLFSVIILLTGCKKPDEVQKVPEKSDIESKESKSDSSRQVIEKDIYEGLYVKNINASSFRDCRHPDSLYWVTDKTKTLEGLYNKLFTDANVYNSVVVKVKGEMVPTETAGLIDMYPRTLMVKEVLSVEKKNPDNTCVPYNFWGSGNDPKWSVQISETENLIELDVPSEKKIYNFFYAERKEENGEIKYSNYNTVQRSMIEVVFKKQICKDSLSGKTYDYSVNVNLNGGKNFIGCAIKGSAQ